MVGVPFKHHGRTIRGGLDCAGIVLLIGKDLGLEIPHPPSDYERAMRLSYVMDQMRRTLDPVPVTFAKPGMVVVLQPQQSPAHLAILDSMRTVVEAVNEPDLMQVVRRPVDWSTVRGVFGYRGVDY